MTEVIRKPEITRKRVGELMRGVFKILFDAPDGLPAKEVLHRLEQVVPATEFEKSDYPKHPAIRRFEKMARVSSRKLLAGAVGCAHTVREALELAKLLPSTRMTVPLEIGARSVQVSQFRGS
jgi:hypothetical protein